MILMIPSFFFLPFFLSHQLLIVGCHLVISKEKVESRMWWAADGSSPTFVPEIARLVSSMRRLTHLSLVSSLSSLLLSFLFSLLLFSLFSFLFSLSLFCFFFLLLLSFFFFLFFSPFLLFFSFFLFLTLFSLFLFFSFSFFFFVFFFFFSAFLSEACSHNRSGERSAGLVPPLHGFGMLGRVGFFTASDGPCTQIRL